jgi:paraquat-inducible protein B
MPETAVDEPRPRNLLSFVWIVPILALAISAFLVWRNYAERGPLVEIVFENASGIAAGETELRYRDVVVGRVEEVGFTDGLGMVRVGVRVTQEVAPFIDDQANFWVVRPEVSTRGVSGLQTVLSGVYIQGAWDLEAGGLVTEHAGRVDSPLFEPGREGLQLVLTTEAGEGLNAEAPILYKGIEVGRVARARLAEDGLTAIAEAVIFAPHDRLVTSATRFYDASGFSFSLGASGAELDFASLATLISGGVAFDSVVTGGEPVEDGAVFRVFPDETAARATMALRPGEESLVVSAVFEGDVGGLTPGAAVELGGLTIGEVVSVAGLVDRERFGDDELRLVTALEIRPSQLGLEPGDAPLAFLRARVEGGLRARLASASFLTGALKVELADVPDAAEAALDEAVEPYPVLPSVPSDLPDVAASATGLFERLSSLPLEDLLFAATSFLDGAAGLANSPDLQAAPGELRGILADLRAVTNSEGVQALPERVDATLRDLATASAAATVILEELREQEAAARLLATVDSAGDAAGAVAEAAEEAPELVAGLAALVLDLREPIPQIVARANGILGDVESITGSEAVQAIPAGVRLAIDEFGGVLVDFREQEILRLFAEAAIAAEEAATSTEETALEFAEASEGLPALIAELQGVAEDVRALPIDAAIVELTNLLGSLDSLAGRQSVQRLPDELSRTVREVNTVLLELRSARVGETLVATLAAARDAAQDVAAASDAVPGIVEDVSALTATLRDLPLEPLVSRATDLVGSADALVDQDSTRALPGAFSGALTELRTALAELREGGTVENVNAALASARLAAEGVAGAAEDLPALVERLGETLATAQSTLADYGGDAALPREARAALREIQSAADAVASLARAIERRPNSLILGR